MRHPDEYRDESPLDELDQSLEGELAEANDRLARCKFRLRDAEAERDQHKIHRQSWQVHCEHAERQRESLRAENEELKRAIRAAHPVLAQFVFELECPGDPIWDTLNALFDAIQEPDAPPPEAQAQG